MNGIDVLSGAIEMIKSRGLALGTAIDQEGRVCTAAALVEVAGGDKNLGGRFQEKGYLEARSALTSVLGISDSYQALAEWTDMTTAAGNPRFRERKPRQRNVGEVVGAMRKAIHQIKDQQARSAA